MIKSTTLGAIVALAALAAPVRAQTTAQPLTLDDAVRIDRKSTRLNSSHTS